MPDAVAPRSPIDVRPLPSKRRRLSITSEDDFTSCREENLCGELSDGEKGEMVAGDEEKLGEWNNYEDERRIYPQDRCLFLAKLPLEIRQIIYKEVLGGYRFHLTIYTGWRLLRHDKARGNWLEEIHDPDIQQDLLLPLLQTCRRIYTEATAILYSQNVFCVRSSAHLLALTSSLRLNRFNSITSLTFHWTVPTFGNISPFMMIPSDLDYAEYDLRFASRVALCHRTCLVLQSMKALQRLQVTLWPYISMRHGLREDLKMMLRALKIIKRPNQYEVVVGWPEPTVGSSDYEVLGLEHDFHECPYTLRWMG